jgi:hypothetical protein
MEEGTASMENPLRRASFRMNAVAGIAGALITFAFGLLHPKGRSDVGSLTEWMAYLFGPSTVSVNASYVSSGLLRYGSLA